MKKLKSLLSLFLIVSLLAGIIPFADLVPTAYAVDDGAMTVGATEVDLDALMAIIDDDTDSNNDGLPDQLCRILGLDPDLTDSNGDGLSDKFKLDNGLDPLSTDTYDIGITDLYALTKGDADLPLTSDLLDVDTDGDGTPDISDTDIDGDGVPNGSDLSPFSSLSASDSQTITLETDGNSVNVKLQVQPADMESLRKNSRIMTWPIDTEGQMNNIDDSEDNVKIVPMLEVDLPEALSDDIISEWGYVYFNDQLYLPLQYVDDDYEPVALSAELYLPENYGEDISLVGGETPLTAYQIEVTFRLSWLMVAQTHDLSAEWEPFAKIQIEKTGSRPVYKYDATGAINLGMIDHWEEYQYLSDVKLEGSGITDNDFGVTYYNEILGSSVADQNDNDIPDVTVFWYSGDREQVMQNIYYDLSYDEDGGVYVAASQECKSVPQCDYIDDNQAHIEATSDELYRTRVNNAKYAIDLVEYATYAVTHTAYYTAYDGYLEVTPNFEKGFSAEPFTIDDAGYYKEIGNPIYSELFKSPWPWNPQQYSYIRDTAFLQVPTDFPISSKGEIWFLYETYNPDLECNQIVLVLEDSSTGENVVTSHVLLSGLEPDPDTQGSRFSLQDLDKALSLDIHDVNKDGVDDLMFTTRDGRMFYIEDLRADTNWTDRMYELPDGRDTDGIFSQSTQYYDFNNDGTDELVSIQAVRSSDYYNTDLTFQISTKEDITTTSKILMKDTVAFSITGLQADEHEGLDTTVLAGDHTEDLVYMASLLQQYYLQGDRSMEDTVDAYISDVLEGDDSWLDRSTGSYAHLYEALLDIGEQISENETWKSYDGPQPLLILTWGEENLINLDDADDVDRGGDTLRLAIPSDKTVINKQLILKWHDDGATLSADDITDMVNTNDAGVYEFEEDPDGAAEVLAALNIGVSEIIGIGDDITEAETLYALKQVMTEWKDVLTPKNIAVKIPILAKTFSGQLYKMGITKFIKPNMLNFASSSNAYNAQLAKYNNMLGNYRKIGAAINGAGILVDVGVAVYSGYLYGQSMAEAGGTVFGTVTGVTYGAVAIAQSLLTLYLVSIGPVGWIFAAPLAVDSLLTGMLDNYPGYVTTAIMEGLFSTDTYTGTQLMSIENTDNCKTETTGMDYGVVVGSQIHQVVEQNALIRANSQNSPANDKASLNETWAFIDISYSGSAIKNYTNYTKKDFTETVYEDDGFWYSSNVNYNDDTIEFLKAGINIPVVRTTRLDTRLIGSVTVNRYVVYTTTDEDITESTYIDKQTNYYDVLPQSLSEFWQTFTLIPDDWNQKPDAANNELSYQDAYYDFDGDGLPDNVEEALGLNPKSKYSDGDNLTDHDELKYGLDPLSSDTDGDGVGDLEEATNRYPITITTSKGSVEALIRSDPTKADTDGDGISDYDERLNGTNAASCCTNGSPLFDGNAHAPVIEPQFEDQNVVDGDTVTLNLPDYFSDEDGDTLEFDADYGTISDDGVLTYQFLPANDGAVVEITVSASDQKGGVCKDAFQVYDDTKPVITSIQATYPDDASLDSVTPLVLTEFEDELYTNPTFVVSFNKPINFDGIDTAAITIAPIENADLDTNWDLIRHSTAVTVEQVDSSTIEITRTEPIVENAINYELNIPADAITDNSDHLLEQGLTSTFYTGDHVYPWIVSVSDYADLNTPLVLTFSEDVVLTGDQRIDLFAVNEIHTFQTPVGIQTGPRTIEVPIRENFYTSGEPYRFGDSFDYVKDMSGGQSTTAPSAYYDNITDVHGNKLYTEAVLSDANRTFTVGDVSGPEINETQHVFSDTTIVREENWYEVSAEDNGEIRIDWTVPIFEGDDFEGIFLLHGDAATYWLNADSIVDRDELKKLAVEPKACRIEDKTLIITPPDDLIASGVSIEVLIPNTALVDGNGLGIYDSRRSKEMWNQSVRVPNTKPFYISVAASTAASEIQSAERVMTLADRSYTGMILALCSLPEQTEQIVDPGNTLTVLSTQTITNVSAAGITLYKVLDDGSEVAADYQAPYVLTTDENPNPTRAFAIDLDEPMLAGETYVLKIAAGAIGSNPEQELSFTVGDQPTDYCGVNNLTTQSVTGLIKVGEEVSASSGFQKYYDQIDQTLSYQWYIGDTDIPGYAQQITGATGQIYVPQASDEGKYLFLKLTADTTAEDSQIENPFVCWGSSTSTYMTQSLGVVEPALLQNTDLIKLSVMESGDEATELLTDFDSATTEYHLDLDFGTESVRVNALAGTESNATVYINGSLSEDWTGSETQPDGLDILLYPGANKITVKVVAEDTRQSKEYTLTITRGGASDADTSQLKPLAKQVGVRNDMELYTGQTLYGEYVFYDYLGRAESGTTYKWYRSSDKTDTDKTAIPGATGQTYTLTSEDAGKYIFFEVTPQADGSVSGDAVRSLGIGMVTATDALTSDITDIEVLYGGNNLLGDYSAAQKVYPITFAMQDDQSQVQITVTGGSSVSINGTAGSTATVDLQNTTVIEITADASGASGQTSYYILLDSRSKPTAVVIEGDEAASVDGSADVEVEWQGIIYDQYSDLMNTTLDWTVPSGLSESESGLYRQYLTLTVPAAASSGNYSINAAVSSALEVFEVKTLTVTAQSSGDTGDTGDSGTSGTGGGSTAPYASVSGEGTRDGTMPIVVNTTEGSATVDGSGLTGGFTDHLVITAPAIDGVSSNILELPASNLSAQQDGSLLFQTEFGSITIPDNMLSGISGAEGETVGITISYADASDLPDAVKTLVGHHPVVQLSLTVDEEPVEWNNPDAPVTVSVPYTPTAAELQHPEHIVVWYIDGSGKVVAVPNGHYDPETGMVTFTTTHFSYYAIAYVEKTFSDLNGYGWASESIEILASKGIVNGTGADSFSPAADITRADYLVLLIRTLGLTADFTDNFDDIPQNAYYYEACGIAKALGISTGSGNNLFNPQERISRQDMMVLTARALEKYEGLTAAESSAVLDQFADRADIAGYAAQSLATLVSEGLIQGSDNKLTPTANSTRAEAAVFLYRIYEKFTLA